MAEPQGVRRAQAAQRRRARSRARHGPQQRAGPGGPVLALLRGEAGQRRDDLGRELETTGGLLEAVRPRLGEAGQAAVLVLEELADECLIVGLGLDREAEPG